MIWERTNAGLKSARGKRRLKGRPKGYTKEAISKLLLYYKDVTKRPEDIYKPFGLTKATFCRNAKILHNHTDEEIKQMPNKLIFYLLIYLDQLISINDN